MPTPRRTSIIVVGGTLAVASVAYGLGTQAGDGTAIADSQNSERGVRLAADRGGPCGPSRLADELGVDETKLEQALRDFRESDSDGVRADFAKNLAAALGVSADKVQNALDKLAGQRDRRFGPGPPHMHHRFGPPLRGLAKELGVSASELRSALRELGSNARDRMEQHNRVLAEFLAKRFNLDVDEVMDALAADRPPLMSPHLPDHPPAF